MFLNNLAVLGSLVLSRILPTHAAPTPSPQSQWQSQLLNTPSDWQKYVRAPASNIISPVRILSSLTEGNVTNPEGLLTPGTAPTILTRPIPHSSNSEDIIPTIVIDFGQNIVGFLSISFAGAANFTPGLPEIRLAFSETIQYGYLTNISDFTRSDNVS
jgi:hypothetical protein